MMTLFPNLDREDRLDTVLEVPIPAEVFSFNNKSSPWQNMKSWVKSHTERPPPSSFRARNTEIQILLGVVGAPLIPFPIRFDHPINKTIKDHPIEASMAKYIVQQYVAATGEKGL
ncbi:unnamed protein product [Ilex paraguariensis]|uniref:Uncharacterized protein n=1 Tax=Ilex paraguariensis TaxID=185542 RepID=A0ABC8REX1_9AQUA